MVSLAATLMAWLVADSLAACWKLPWLLAGQGVDGGLRYGVVGIVGFY